MDKKDSFDHLEGEIDKDKRDTLVKMAKAAWVVPVVATFGLSSLGEVRAGPIVANGLTRS
jgi:hypothetical protein